VDQLTQRVRKANRLNEAKFRLTTTEYRILLLCVSKVKPMTDDVPNKFRIYGTEFADMFGISTKNAYKQIREGLDSTWDKQFFERIPATKGTEAGWRRRRFVITQEYNPGEGYGELEFHPDFLQHLVNLREQYTDYGLRNVTHLPSFNVIRVYELLVQFRKVGHRTFEISWFKELLGLENSYPRFKDLRTHVIEPALKLIDAHTDIQIIKHDKKWFRTEKRGKKVIAFEVYFRHKAQQTLDLDEPQPLPVEEPVTPQVEYEWEAAGYRTEGEYRDARNTEKRYGVTFNDAREYIAFTQKLQRRA
jgi:plasmid replication initiation protein